MILLFFTALGIALAQGPDQQESVYDQISMVNVTPIALTRLDPILSPGKVVGHTHVVIGGSAFGPHTDYDTAAASQCTSMTISIDNSAYWVPPMYHINLNGTYSVAFPVSNVTLYTRSPSNGTVHEFPVGFGTLGGSRVRNSLNATNRDKWTWFDCHTPKGAILRSELIPQDVQCEWIGMVINFPSCWSGTNLTTGLANSHVAHGNGSDWADCLDPRFPIRLPRISYTTLFDMRPFEWRPNSTILATGDKTGLRAHADFLNGWRVGYLTDLFAKRETCTDPQGVCPFIPSADINTAASDCRQDPLTAEIVAEEVGLLRPISQLPGCDSGADRSVSVLPGCESEEYLQRAVPEIVHADKLVRGMPVVDLQPVATTSSSSDPSSSTSPILSPPSSGTNVGAIVGGVIGGLVALSLLVALCVFLVQKRKRSAVKEGGIDLSSDEGTSQGSGTRNAYEQERERAMEEAGYEPKFVGR